MSPRYIECAMCHAPHRWGDYCANGCDKGLLYSSGERVALRARNARLLREPMRFGHGSTCCEGEPHRCHCQGGKTHPCRCYESPADLRPRP